MSDCPSCGRFVGPYEICPHCGARRRARVSLRLLKIAALILAVGGLAGLWFAATRAEVPRVRIDQLRGLMNMAYVRIEGCVSRGPSYNEQSQTLSFWVSDESGEELLISAYRSEVRDLVAQGKVPALGDQVSVAGTLRIREDFQALSLNVPARFQITRAEPVEAKIGEISAMDVGRRVRVRGRVRGVYTPYPGLTLVTLRDDSGVVEVAVGEVLGLTGPLPHVVPGQALEVIGAVSLYEGSVQLVPASSSELVPSADVALAAPRWEIGRLSSADVGRWVQVQGQIVERDAFSGGVRFTLDDGSGRIALLLWQVLYAQIPYSGTLDVGARVEVQGSVAEYRGTLEVVPELPQDVAILIAAPEPLEVTVAALGPADVGRVVVVRGVLGQADPFSQGVRYPLVDGAGEILLLLWSDVAGQVPAGLGPGADVRVTGEVAMYKGNLEIVPRRGGDVEVLGQRPLPTATPLVLTPIGAITAADEGRRLTVLGTLGDVQTFSRGIRFPLYDESGEIILLLWQDVVDSFPEVGSLAAGVRVQVTGEIAVYQGVLEIIPQAEGIAIVE